MSTIRRRLVRPAAVSSADPHRQQKLQRLRGRLESERISLARWQSKLKRAFNAVQRCQAKITRLERQLANLED